MRPLAVAMSRHCRQYGRDPAVSVVVPVKNEAGNIAPLVAEIAAAMQGRAFEVVYVNDGSSDATEQELLGLMATCRWLRRYATLTDASANFQTPAVHPISVINRSPNRRTRKAATEP